MRPSERFVWGRIVEEYEIGPYHARKLNRQHARHADIHDGAKGQND